MKSPKTFPQDKTSGFTLVEILVVLGLFALLGSLGLIVSMDFYRTYSFHHERNIMIGLIQKARSESIANINEKTHGFCIKDGKYIIFEGTDCNSHPQKSYEISGSISISPSPPFEIAFEQLSGKTSNKSFTMTSYSKSSTISINEEGRIYWTN